MRKAVLGWKTLGLGAAAATMFSAGICVAADPTPDEKNLAVIKEVMEKAHKGNDTPQKRAAAGKATAADLTLLVDLYKKLADTTKPSNAPKGTPEDWKTKTAALLASTEKLAGGDKSPEAIAAYKTASDCRGCHSLYRKPG